MTQRGRGDNPAPSDFKIMDLASVADIIQRISDGFEDACERCLNNHSGIVLLAVTEQMYGGQSGSGNYLTPNYDNDPFFEEEGYWHHRAKDYKAWKRAITPPVTGSMLGLPPRPDDVPNLFIDGTFYSQITARRIGDGLLIDPGNGNGPDIVAKYGDDLLDMGPTAVRYFNDEYMLPAIGRHFKDCGYQ